MASVHAPKCPSHVRSNSLPRGVHPFSMNIEEQLNRIKSSEATSTFLATQKLGILKGFFDCVDDLLKLPLSQQVLLNEHHRSSVEKLLDGSLELLDVCGNAKDAFSQTKECIKELEPVLRRRKGGDCCLAKEVETYIGTRKKLQKIISKYLVNLKKMKRKNSLNKDSNKEATLSMLRQDEEISLSVFASLLCFLSQLSANPNRSGWSLVSKLLSSKQVACEGEEDANEMATLDFELLSLKSGKASCLQVSDILKRSEPSGSSGGLGMHLSAPRENESFPSRHCKLLKIIDSPWMPIYDGMCSAFLLLLRLNIHCT